MVSRRDLVVAVLLTFCVTASLFTITMTRGQGGDYDPWLDINNDGYIGIDDIYSVATHFGIEGIPVAKGSIEYDSGWINITDKCGLDVIITHGLNSTDIMVDVQGKTNLVTGSHQKHYGLTGYSQGWSKTYGGTSSDYAFALVQTADGGYALVGYTYSYGAGSADFWLVKTDVSGNAQWNKTYGGTNGDAASALVQTADGGYALAGYTVSYGAGNWDFWLVKTDAESGLGWVDSDANSITLHRGLTDIYWNYVRVRVWKPRETP